MTDFAFNAQRAEPSLGLQDFNARYFSSKIGRFLTPDSIVPDFSNPQDLNRYAYVINNPLKFVDPDGHCRGLAGVAYNVCAKTVTTLAPAVHKANEYRDDVFFPDENTTSMDRLEAGAAIGGVIIGSTVAIATLAPAGVVAAVSTSSATALTGSAVGAGGNLAGQAINKAKTGESIDYNETLIAGTTGFVAGGLAPFAATTIPGSMALGGLSSTGQYVLTQNYHKESVTPEGVLVNASVGAAMGFMAGPVPPRASQASLPFAEYANNPALRNQAIIDMYRGQLSETLTRSGFVRMGVGATGSNLDWTNIPEK